MARIEDAPKAKWIVVVESGAHDWVDTDVKFYIEQDAAITAFNAAKQNGCECYMAEIVQTHT